MTFHVGDWVRAFALTAGFSAALAFAHPAAAGIVLFEARHLVTQSTLAGTAVGDTIVTRFAVDTAAGDLDPSPARALFQRSAAAGEPGWTGYNTHDPGVTLLDVLVYSIEVLLAVGAGSQDALIIAGTNASNGLYARLHLAFLPGTFGDDSPPDAAPPPDRLDPGHSFYEIEYPGGAIAGDVIAVTTVSEPPAAALLAIGLAGALMAGAGRRPRYRVCLPKIR